MLNYLFVFVFVSVFVQVRLCQTVDRERNVAVKQVDLRKIKKERQEVKRLKNVVETQW